MMELVELKERYKMTSPWVRYGLMFVLGVLPGLYIFMQQSATLDQELEQATADETQARMKFDQARRDKANLPNLEAKLVTIEEQLNIARKILPDDFFMDEILHTTAVIAREVGVEIVDFHPLADLDVDMVNHVRKRPVDLAVKGEFKKIANFYDRLVHLDKLLHLKGIKLATDTSLAKTQSTLDQANGAGNQTQKATIINATVQMYLYASLSGGQAGYVQ